MRADLVGERAARLRPARGHPVAVDVLGAVHRRHRAGEPLALVQRAVDLHALSPLLEIGRRAEPRHERAAYVAEERERRGERGVELAGAEIEQGMPGTALEGARDAGAGGGRQAVSGVFRIRRGAEQ